MTSPSIAVIAACPFPVNYGSPAATRDLVKRLGDNHAHARVVRRGLMSDGMTEILEGVQEGEQVVTVGMLELHDKDRVLVNQSGPWNK